LETKLDTWVRTAFDVSEARFHTFVVLVLNVIRMAPLFTGVTALQAHLT